MKDIININVKTRTVDLGMCKTDVLVVGHFSDSKRPQGPAGVLNSRLDNAIERLIKLGDFTGKEGTNEIIYGNEKIGAKRVLLVGLGEKKKAELDTVRKAAANAAKKAGEIKAKTLALALHPVFEERFDLSTIGQACAEGTYLGGYRYDTFVTDSGNGRSDSLKVEVIDSDRSEERRVGKEC